MGGVDKTNFLVKLYRINIRCRKRTLNVMFHFITLSITNSWLEYMSDFEKKNISRKKRLDLIAFSTHILESVTKQENPMVEQKRGRTIKIK